MYRYSTVSNHGQERGLYWKAPNIHPLCTGCEIDELRSQEGQPIFKERTRPDIRQSSRGWLGMSSIEKTTRNIEIFRTYRPTWQGEESRVCH